MPAQPPEPTDAPSPGARATALSTIYGSALSATLRNVSYAHFAACFPTPAARCPAGLRALWAQMVERLEGCATAEFEAILAERGVVPALNELDALIADAQRRKASSATSPSSAPVPPHTLPPPAHLKAHLTPYLAHAQSHLNARLQTAQSRNAALAEGVAAQRAELRRLVAGLEGVVSDLERAGDVLAVGDEAVRAELLEADAVGGKT
ncbi:MAG: hypothetical protein M1832_002205 [Thelocarpon impressellum]|nr:MAG: hypothetical protein M1832_002205 [Thelocarpon impressellum]